MVTGRPQAYRATARLQLTAWQAADKKAATPTNNLAVRCRHAHRGGGRRTAVPQ